MRGNGFRKQPGVLRSCDGFYEQRGVGGGITRRLGAHGMEITGIGNHRGALP